jgi:hypothetical protein
MSADVAYEFHRYANIFPLMSDEEESTLRDDIKKHGLRKPILLFEDKILDGRNRYRQCAATSTVPRFAEFAGTKQEALDLVRSLNLCRRDLTSSQRAACSLEYEKECARLAKERLSEGGGDRKSTEYRESKSAEQIVAQPIRSPQARDQAAEAFGTNKQYVQDAKKIAEVSPETLEKVKKGELTIPQAKKELGLRPPKPTGKSRVDGELVDDPPEIAKLRAKGKIAEGVILVIEEVCTEGATDEEIEAEEEARKEREAIQQESKTQEELDEEFIKGLPLYGQLKDQQLRIFVADVRVWLFARREVAAARRKLSEACNKFCRRGKGRYAHKASSFFRSDDPARWIRCASFEHDGCAGTGYTGEGGMKQKCRKCYGAGYWING